MAAFLPMLASQLARLAQTSAAGWLFFDYAGRLGMLAVLAAIPAARRVVFVREALRIGLGEAALWIAALAFTGRVLDGLIIRSVARLLPSTAIAQYPEITGLLHMIDLVLGIWLVAYSEEVLFRRAALAALRPWLGEGAAMVLGSAALFAAYHWWTGLGNVLGAFAFGVVAMLAYRRCRALWPLVVGHYLADLAWFA